MSKKELIKLRKETIKKLQAVKENLSYDNEENYCNMVNTMIDYDNEAQDKLYLYDSTQETYNFVDDEILIYLIEREKNNYGYYDLNRLRYFIGDTYDDSIYILNGYGNLENVTQNDFIYCIDEAIERLQESLEEC